MNDKSVRKPKQSRSKDTKEKIINTAFELFCEKGYFKTTTNEIAKKAEVSIGSLYSYFTNKDMIFMEVLEKYNEKFDITKYGALNNIDLYAKDQKAWLRLLFENLILIHEETKELNRELSVLSYYNADMAKILDQQKKKSLQKTIEFFEHHNSSLISQDTEALATVIFDLISSTVDRIVFGNNEIQKDRLIDSTINLIYNACWTSNE